MGARERQGGGKLMAFRMDTGLLATPNLKLPPILQGDYNDLHRLAARIPST